MYYGFRNFIVFLWWDICFEPIDEICPFDAENEAFIRANRGLARSVLTYALLVFLPLALAVLTCACALVWGGGFLFGLPANALLLFAALMLMASQLIGAALLLFLCTLQMNWEPRGAVLALADMLHTSPHGLQHVWRALSCLPLVALALLLIWR